RRFLAKMGSVDAKNEKATMSVVSMTIAINARGSAAPRSSVKIRVSRRLCILVPPLTVPEHHGGFHRRPLVACGAGASGLLRAGNDLDADGPQVRRDSGGRAGIRDGIEAGGVVGEREGLHASDEDPADARRRPVESGAG